LSRVANQDLKVKDLVSKKGRNGGKSPLRCGDKTSHEYGVTPRVGRKRRKIGQEEVGKNTLGE